MYANSNYKTEMTISFYLTTTMSQLTTFSIATTREITTSTVDYLNSFTKLGGNLVANFMDLL